MADVLPLEMHNVTCCIMHIKLKINTYIKDMMLHFTRKCWTLYIITKKKQTTLFHSKNQKWS